jgi:16S rRNA (cytidine1402-2'-O)-methyltransferase
MLYLLPNSLNDEYNADDFSSSLKGVINGLDAIICESKKIAIRYLLKFLERDRVNSIPIYLLNEHSNGKDLEELLDLIKNKDVGLLSDAGLSCIADPGSNLVFLANQKNIKVKALFGPSSIFLALMLSGLNSQKFYFHGYLPKEEKEIIKKLKKIESEILVEVASQVFIETPYRADRLLDLILKNIRDDIFLSLVINLTKNDERVITKKVGELRKDKFVIGKNLVVFVLGKN